MPRTDYNAYSMATKEETVIEEKVEEVVADEESEILSVNPPPEPQFAVVTDCAKLNVRIYPIATAKVLCVVGAGTQLMIDPTDSTKDWCHVYTSAGIEGYCMRAYLRFE